MRDKAADAAQMAIKRNVFLLKEMLLARYCMKES